MCDCVYVCVCDCVCVCLLFMCLPHTLCVTPLPLRVCGRDSQRTEEWGEDGRIEERTRTGPPRAGLGAQRWTESAQRWTASAASPLPSCMGITGADSLSKRWAER